jgi:hypothetical protein
MQKKKSTRFKATDLVIVLLCIAGSLASGAAFWNEYNRTLTKLNEDPVGTISFKKRTAQRKFIDRVVWDRLKEASPVYNGDTIRTIEYSELKINFRNDITYLTMNENSLIQVFYNDVKGATIDFTGGNIEVNSGSGSVTIISGDSQIVLEGQAEIVKGEQGFSFAVTEGEAVFDGEKVETGQILAIDESGQRDIRPAIAVTSFGSSARILCPPSGTVPVVFEWNESNFTADTSVIVEIAQDRAFNRIVTSQQAKGVSFASITLGSGNYWWRAYPTNGEIRSGTLEMIPASPSSLVTPANNAEITVIEEASVSFSWTAATGATAYQLDISDNANMGNPVSRRVEQTAITISGLEAGKWYWRVSPILPDWITGSIPPSGTGEFTLVKGAAMEGPQLHYPADNANISLDASATARRLFWLHDSNAEAWLVEMADNSAITNPVVKQRVIFNYFPLPENLMQDGKTWYWRVSALNGTISAPSDTRTFSVSAVKQQAVVENRQQGETGAQPAAQTAQPSQTETRAAAAPQVIFYGAGWVSGIFSDNEAVAAMSSVELKAARENIQGQQKEVLTVTAAMPRPAQWINCEFNTTDESILQKLKAGTGVRFKVQHTDGKNTGWYLEMPTREQIDGCFYEAPINLQSGGVTEINIPYSSLRQPDWGFQRRFNQSAIASIMIRRTGEGPFNAAGSSTIKIFDFEIYNEPAAAPQTTTSQSAVTPAPQPATAPAQPAVTPAPQAAEPARQADIPVISNEAGWQINKDNRSSVDLSIRREVIDGQEREVMTLNTTLSNDGYAGCILSNDNITQRLRTASGVRFKVLGDGKQFSILVNTSQTKTNNRYTLFQTTIPTRNGIITEVDVPYSRLRFFANNNESGSRFVKENIQGMTFERNTSLNGTSGRSTVKIFDFEIY